MALKPFAVCSTARTEFVEGQMPRKNARPRAAGPGEVAPQMIVEYSELCRSIFFTCAAGTSRQRRASVPDLCPPGYFEATREALDSLKCTQQERVSSRHIFLSYKCSHRLKKVRFQTTNQHPTNHSAKHDILLFNRV